MSLPATIMSSPSRVGKTWYGAIWAKALPSRPGISPVARYPTIWYESSQSAVSYSDTSIVAPPPRSSAATIAKAAQSPVERSMSDTPTRTGGIPSTPVTLMIPLAAWRSGS